MISTIFLCFFISFFFHSCHAVHLQWNRNAEMQRAELREREKREADALFFIVTFPWALRRTLWTRFLIGWMGKRFVRYSNMAGRWRHCLFSFKARARSPKVKGVEKVWLITVRSKRLMNSSVNVWLNCIALKGMMSVFPHIFFIWDWTEVFFSLCQLLGAFIKVLCPTKKSLVVLKLHPFPPGKGSCRDILQFVCLIPPFFSKPGDLLRKNVF